MTTLTRREAVRTITGESCSRCKGFPTYAAMHEAMEYHTSHCSNWLAGYDCMHFEDAEVCNCTSVERIAYVAYSAVFAVVANIAYASVKRDFQREYPSFSKSDLEIFDSNLRERANANARKLTRRFPR